MKGKKLIIFLGLALVAHVALASAEGAVERCVLAELFTSTAWGACDYAEAALDSVVKYDLKPEQLAVIRNHVAGHFYKLEANQRFFWYPETYVSGQGWAHWTPTLWLDGIEDVMELGSVTYTWGVYKSEIAARMGVPSPLMMDIEVYYGAKADPGTVHVQVVATDPIAFSGLRLHLAIVESGLFWDGETWNQVLRDYFPDRYGIAFSIAQGDTFTHSEDFIIQAAWDPENCKIVAFVQDNPTYEVLQAIQSPVIVPTPAMVMGLTATLVEDDVRLDWSSVTEDTHGNPLTIDHYNIYRNNTGFFEPGSDPFTTTVETHYVDDTGVVGDTETNYFYWVTAVAGYKESGSSGLVGEYDRVLVTAK